MCRSIAEGGRRCPSSSAKPVKAEGVGDFLKGKTSKPSTTASSTENPPSYPEGSPDRTQRKRIKAWKGDIADLNPKDMLNEIAAGISTSEAARIQSMSVTDFGSHMDDLRDRFAVDTTVTGIPDGYRVTADDPAEHVVRHLGHHANTWLAGQPSVKKAMAGFANTTAEFDAKDRRISKGFIEGFYQAQSQIGAAVVKELKPVLHNAVGTSAVFRVDGMYEMAADGRSYPASDDEQVKIIGHLNEVSRLFPDALKNRPDNHTAQVVVTAIPRDFYLSMHRWVDSKGREHRTGVIAYRSSSDTPVENLAHELTHYAQWQNKYLRALESSYLERRASHTQPCRVGGDEEQCFPGEFPSIYTGKVYPNGIREVLPTGVQQLYFGHAGAGVGAGVDPTSDGSFQTDPATGRLRADPDHLNFTLGVLLSARKM